MIYELRQYTVAPGKMPAVQARFRDVTSRLFEKYGMTNVGYWTNVIGGRSDEFCYMLAYRDLAHREEAWAAFVQDPERLAARAAADAEGPQVLHTTNRIMTPLDFSPLK